MSVDDRGFVGFVNGLDLSKVKRIYTVENHEQVFVRAWHGHKHEEKYVMAVSGEVMVGVVKVDDWESPTNTTVNRYYLSSHKPSLLHIPAGHANGFKSLTKDAKLMFFSTSTLDESKNDDYRFPFDYWDIWKAEQR